jgi:hypothetical protein
MARTLRDFDRASSAYRLLNGYLCRVGSTGADFDAFAADLARFKDGLPAGALLELAVTACDYGKAGHAYLLLQAGVDADELNVYMMRILPDDQQNFQRLRRDAFNSATGHLTFDKIMQEQGKGAAAMEKARNLDYLQRFPERYMTLADIASAKYNPPTL